MPTPTTLRFARFVLGIAAAATISSVATAQSEPTSSPRELVAGATRLQRLHLYEAALVEYKKAFAVAPTASTLRHIAEVERELGDAQSATSSYESLLAAKDASRDDKKAAEKALAALAAESGTLTIAVTPEGAAVDVDGRATGTSPVKPLRLGAQAHVVRVTKEGYEPFTSTVEVAAGGSATVAVALVAESKSGSLYVHDKNDRHVHISIDGKEAGVTPYRGDLPEGTHAIGITEPKLSAPGVVAVVTARQRTEVVVEVVDTVGRVELQPEPKGAEISVDGKPLPAAERAAIELSPGRHVFVARAPGYSPTTETLDVVAGAPLTWRPRLVRVVAAQKQQEASYDGGHFDVGLHGRFAVAGQLDGCAKTPPPGTCSTGTGLGGGLVLRTGYNFGVIGVDLTVLPSFGVKTDDVSYAGGASVAGVPEASFSHTQTIKVTDFGGLAAIGPSFATHGTVARVAGGLGAGVAVRAVSLERTMSGQLQDAVTLNDVVVGPGGVAHLGLLLGSTPGAKFEIALLASVEKLSYATPALQRQLPSTTVTVPAYDVYKDVQVYIGPALGGRFGY